MSLKRESHLRYNKLNKKMYFINSKKYFQVTKKLAFCL